MNMLEKIIKSRFVRETLTSAFCLCAIGLATISFAKDEKDIKPPIPPGRSARVFQQDWKGMSKPQAKTYSLFNPATVAEFIKETVNREQVINTKPGWNMIGLQVETGDSLATKLIPVPGIVYDYCPDKGYGFETELQSRKGCFYRSEDDKAHTFTVFGKPLTQYTVDLKTGWNLIGSVVRQENFTDPKDNPDESVIPKVWKLVDGDYVEGTVLEDGSYWIKAEKDCKLTIGQGETPGVIGNLVLTGASAEEPTLATYDWIDHEGDPDMSIVEWRKNGQTLGNTGLTIPADQKSAGDILEARILSFDGIDYGEIYSAMLSIDEGDKIPPKVLSTNTNDNFNVSQDVLVTFTEPLNDSTISSSSIYLSIDSIAVPASVSWDLANNQVRINPITNLPYSVQPTLTAKGTIEDLAGNKLDGNDDGTAGDSYEITFSTSQAPDTTPPKITGNNLSQSFDITKNIELLVNEELQQATINDQTIILEKNGIKMPGLITYDSQNNKITLNPDVDLEYATNYKIRALPGIMDLAGNRLDGDGNGTPDDEYVADFRTADMLNIPPTLDSLSSLTFNEDDSLIVDYTPKIHDDNLESVVISIAGNTNIIPTINQETDEVKYAITPNWFGSEELTMTITDNGGLKDSKKYTITITSVNDAPIADFTITPNPVEKSNPVFLDATISQDYEDTFNLLMFSWNTNNSWTDWSYSAKKDLIYLEEDSFDIGLRVKDTENEITEIIKQLIVVNDVTPPYVDATNLQDEFPIKNKIEVDINEPISFWELDKYVHLLKGSEPVPGTFAWIGNRKIEFTPSSYLQPNTTYTFQIQNGLTDFSGNLFDGNHDGEPGDDYTKFFKTEAFADVIAPKVAGTNLNLNFNIAANIEVQVDESLDRSTVNNTNVFLRHGGIDIPAAITYDDIEKKIIVNPNAFLGYDKDYDVIVTDGVTDLSGNHLDGDGNGTAGGTFLGTLHTQSAPDSTPPKITGDNLSSSFGISNNIILEVSEALNPSTINNSNIRLKKDGVEIYGTVSWNSGNNEIIFNPNNDLYFSSDYTVTVSPNVTDISGNSLDGNNDDLPGGEYVKELYPFGEPHLVELKSSNYIHSVINVKEDRN
ncbi:Ig-like domain-containing protein, partial [candidate division KSB1 bacterium]|nr:Ig-like domain-containing protein [candidate division KSB1 bacterium]